MARRGNEFGEGNLLSWALVEDGIPSLAARHENGTTLPTPTQERDAIYAEEASKHAYLTSKMRRQLTEGGRIWVYRSPIPVKWSESAGLHAALNRFGPNKLLVVQPNPQRNGQAEPLDQGLFHGDLAQGAPPDKAWFFDSVSWGTLLRATLRLAR